MIQPVLLLLFFASAAVASHAPIRLDDAGNSMEHVAVRNQRSIGDCYAHAAAQIYDAWRFFQGDKDYARQSSGLEINQRFKYYRGESDIDGGRLKEIMPTLSRDGTCAQSDLNSALFKPQFNYDVDAYASKIMEIYSRHQKEFHKELDEESKKIDKSAWFGLTTSGAYDKLEKELRKKYQALAIKELSDHNDVYLLHPFNNSLFSKIKPTARSQRDVVGIFDILGLINCPNGFKMRAPQEFHVDVVNKVRTGWTAVSTPVGTSGMMVDKDHSAEVLQKIHRELDYGKKAMPIGIGYCSTVLEEGRKYPWLYPHKDADGKKVDICGRHASLIIGRRNQEVTVKDWVPYHPSWQPGQDSKKQANPFFPFKVVDKKVVKPQLLIRNTWGNACWPYSKDWECDAKAGSIWVDEDILIQAIFQIQIMDRG